MDRYWWTKVHKYIHEYFKSCEGFQESKPILLYSTTKKFPLMNRFETHSIYFAGLLPTSNGGRKFPPFVVEHHTD